MACQLSSDDALAVGGNPVVVVDPRDHVYVWAALYLIANAFWAGSTHNSRKSTLIGDVYRVTAGAPTTRSLEH